MPIEDRRCNMCKGRTVSKAVANSKNTATTVSWDSKAEAIVSPSSDRASSVERPEPMLR
jgi:hypothetical protein